MSTTSQQSTSTSPTTSNLPLNKWLPIAIIIFLTCGTIGLNGPIISAGTLRLICLELDLPSDCDDKIATQTMASWNMMVSLISGCVMFISVGLWTAIAHRIGRHRTIACALFGIGTLDCLWGLVFRIESLQPYWRYIIGSAVAFNCCTGTVAVVFLGAFGSANDITHKHKATKGWLFSVLEAIVGSTAIISAKVSSYLVKQPLYITMFTASSIFYTLSLCVFLFYTNTIPEKEQRRKIHWNEATLLTALLICIPTKRNIQKLRGPRTEEDGDDDEDDNNDEIEYNNDGGNSLSNNNETNNDTNQTPLLQQHDKHSNIPEYEPIPFPSLGINHQPQQQRLQHQNMNNINNNDKNTTQLQCSVNQNDTIDVLEQDLLLNTSLKQSSDLSQKSLSSTSSTLSSTPHPNPSSLLNHLTPPIFLPFLAFAFFATTFVLYGRKTILFMYFKTEYKIDDSGYANILALDAIGNAVAVIFILPLIKKALQYYSQFSLVIEIWSSFVALIGQGLCYIFLPLLPILIHSGGGIHNNKIWAPSTLLFICGLFSSIPSGILRSGMLNATTKRSQQHRIIACLAAIEALCIISGGLTLNKIYKSLSFIGSAYIVSGSVYITGAIVLCILGILWVCLKPERFQPNLNDLHDDDDDVVINDDNNIVGDGSNHNNDMDSQKQLIGNYSDGVNNSGNQTGLIVDNININHHEIIIDDVEQSPLSPHPADLTIPQTTI